jgi:uncharacterized peroxidase-related enzyme
MARLPIHTAASAPDAARERVLNVEKANGFLPNLIGLLANAPTALETYQTVSGINSRSSLNTAEREAVQITAAAIHGCGFCVAGHTILAYKKAGLSEDIVNALRNGTRVPDARLDAIATFTRAVIRSRGAVENSELQTFKAAGFNDANAVDVVLGVSLATLCNFTNNLGQAPLNPQYEPYAWTPAVAVAAE